MRVLGIQSLTGKREDDEQETKIETGGGGSCREGERFVLISMRDCLSKKTMDDQTCIYW